jgi:hypothetical protein
MRPNLSQPRPLAQAVPAEVLSTSDIREKTAKEAKLWVAKAPRSRSGDTVTTVPSIASGRTQSHFEIE